MSYRRANLISCVGQEGRSVQSLDPMSFRDELVSQCGPPLYEDVGDSHSPQRFLFLSGTSTAVMNEKTRRGMRVGPTRPSLLVSMVV